MKKILTLLLAFGTVAAADAQSSKEEARKVILGGGGNDTKSRPSNGTGRDIILGDNDASRRDYPVSTSASSQINQINREYDAKIASIRNNRTLNSQEKERIIRDLERERKKKINQVKDRYDDRDKKHKKNKNFKNNKGKHKGWTKGKGNPHRNRG